MMTTGVVLGGEAMPNNEALRLVAIDLAWRMYGTPYIWGGDDMIAGFDCSGMQVEILQSVGILPAGDWTAATLAGRLMHHEVFLQAPGCLVFWETSQGYIRHVEMCIGNWLSIGASGGGKDIRDQFDDNGYLVKTALQAAIEHNAFVKVRPIEGRGRIRGYFDPFKEV